jgi:hypothetical protein
MTLTQRLRWQLREIAWPQYACEDCIGAIEHGCWCAATDAVKPGGPGPERWRLWLRRALDRIGWGWSLN